MKRRISLILVVVALLSFASTSYAVPVEYVKICSSYGVGYYYIPGTDICYNPTTGETRQQTDGGTWASSVLRNPGDWVTSAAAGCTSGRLVKVGTFTSDDFTLNPFWKLETSPVHLNLRHDEFISKVIFSGGFDATAKSTFCLYFYAASSGWYSPLGCQDTAEFMDQPATFSFTPIRPVPPPNFTGPISLVGNCGPENWSQPFNGSVSAWVCIAGGSHHH